jgi:hypothetical protein
MLPLTGGGAVLDRGLTNLGARASVAQADNDAPNFDDLRSMGVAPHVSDVDQQRAWVNNLVRAQVSAGVPVEQAVQEARDTFHRNQVRARATSGVPMRNGPTVAPSVMDAPAGAGDAVRPFPWYPSVAPQAPAETTGASYRPTFDGSGAQLPFDQLRAMGAGPYESNPALQTQWLRDRARDYGAVGLAPDEALPYAAHDFESRTGRPYTGNPSGQFYPEMTSTPGGPVAAKSTAGFSQSSPNPNLAFARGGPGGGQPTSRLDRPQVTDALDKATAARPPQGFEEYWQGMDRSSRVLALAGLSVAAITTLRRLFASGDDDDESFLMKVMPLLGLGVGAYGLGGGTAGLEAKDWQLPTMQNYQNLWHAGSNTVGNLFGSGAPAPARR